MRASTASRVAWALSAVVVALAIALVVLVVVIASQPTVGILLDDLGVDHVGIAVLSMVVIALAAVGGATLGVLVVRRRPDNPVGWLVIAAALLGVLLWSLVIYGELGLALRPRHLAAVDWAVVILIPVGYAWFGAILLTVWVFPTGRLASPRWRPVLASVAAALAISTLLLLLIPGPLEEVEGLGRVDNPLGLTALGALSGSEDLVDGVLTGSALLLTLAGLAARFRRSRGEERAQLKWLLYAVVVLVGAIALSLLAGPLAFVAYAVAPLAVPVAMAVAILRYRLYEIDRIISRTAAYAAVTALLVGIYAGLVLLFGVALRPVTADSDLAVAASVLVVAALFQPVRRRVQVAVDRRFNRTRYDAQRTVAAFGERLREEVDLDTLTDELTRVVGTTMEPATVSLWLPTPEARP